MSEYNAYSTLLQSTQAEFVSTETLDSTSTQIPTNSSNNNMMYNTAPLIFLNPQKSDVGLLQNSVMNDGSTYLTIQTQQNPGATELNGAKLLNTPIIIQSSPSIPIQTSQYQQSTSTINVQQQPNANTVTSLTPSQLQSLSYLMQTQITPQFIQTSNGLIQIIPHGLITTQNPTNQISNHNSDQLLSSQITALPTLGWSLNNFNTSNNQISIDNQVHQIQLNNLGIPQLIPVQQIIQPNNAFFNHHTDDQNQIVSTIVDLNANGNDKKSCDTMNKKGSRRKRKQTNKVSVESSQLSSPLAHPTSTNEVMKEAAESSSGKLNSNILNGMNNGDTNTMFDNKGRPFSFLCPECPKKFTLNSRLNAHMRCHTGMRPFTCTVCAFSFTQKSYLIRHAAVHKEERPFHCEKCQKSYKHYGSLANHRKLHRKDEKNETTEMMGDVKMEQNTNASYNGKSSSISSIVMNNCTEYSTNQSFESSTIIPQDINESNNTFSITSSVHSTTGGGNSYIKDLDLYPMATLSQISSDNDNNKSGNFFFQNQQQLDQNYKTNYGNNNNSTNMSDLTSNSNGNNVNGNGNKGEVSSVASHQIFPKNENNRSPFIV